ncbi:hypothetical protein L209DRAFT_766053 [Thermothelomyces heterothallicus CBS 203.75]
MSGPLDDPVLRLKKEEDKVGMLRHQHMQEEDEQLQDDNEQNNNNDVLQRMIALTFVALPTLTSEEDLEVWDTQLRSSLAPYELLRYLDSDVPEPDKDDIVAHAIWEADRADIYRVITTSLKSNILSRMTRIGWNPEVVDPRATYKKVFEALLPATVNTTRLLIQEYITIEPSKFDTMDRYIDRLCVLRQRLRNLGIINPPETDICPVLTAIKESYPNLYKRNIRKMEDKSLTWDDLIKDMTKTCVDLDMKKNFVNVTVGNSGNDNKKMDDRSKPPSDKKRSTYGNIKCRDCDRHFNHEVKHCSGCGWHHNPKQVCWACNPEKAPDSWPKKARFLAKKNAPSSTAAPHPNSGVANPTTSATRGVFHCTNFASIRPSFHSGPRI